MEDVDALVREAEWIEGSADLAAACRRWAAEPALALDTEFVRERTYFPILGLIQIAWPGGIALIDPRTGLDLAPLRALLEDPGIEMVLHSADQDIEVLDSALGVRLTTVFDTQIAAELGGVGASLGYAALVERLFGVTLEKGETRTDWTRRPLSPAQLRYAAQDVRWLLPARERLLPLLDGEGRLGWLREETARLIDERLAPVTPRPPRGLSARDLAVFEALHAWRERTARQRDLPRGFVLKDAVLAPLARRRPTTRRELEEVDVLPPRDRERHGRALLEVIDGALRIPEPELPEPAPATRLPSQQHRTIMKRLQAVVAAAAAAHGLEPPTLASRRVLSETLDRWLSDADPPLPPQLLGWRRDLVGAPLLEALGEEVGALRAASDPAAPSPRG